MLKKEKSVPNFLANEHEVLKFWTENNINQKYINKNKGGEKYYAFLDGPITANSSAGVHHGWNRTLKDAFLKYRTMQGFDAHYQSGFDAQGLWVEVETEKDLGLKDKRDIEALGLDKFTEACMARVNKYAGVIAGQSKRLGQFMDWDNSYFTNSDRNITSIWHFLKVCHEKGWLEKKYRPMPWCSHCGTSLSEHELADNYKDMEHEAVFLKLPIKNTDMSIVVWTTTPWTLCANVAIAVNPEFEYLVCKVKSTDRKLIICKTTKKVLKDDIITVEKVLKGSDLVGMEYETFFEELPQQNFPHKIVAWDMVEADEGAGDVHIAPGCGSEDFELGQSLGLPNILPVDESGIFYDDFGFLAGKEADKVNDLVFEELKKRDKIYYSHNYTHRYAVCWRCKKPLIYRLTEEWYIKVDEIRPLLLKAVEDVEWQPAFLKKNMLAWLENMGDWCISRKRFYGLPLPFYKCEKCGKLHVIGSLEELKKLGGKEEVEALPHLHRPYIDKIKINCECGGKAERVSEVGDCWLDAGITPFSTKKYFEDKEFFEKNFPAECVIEMREQIRLWFYALLFMSVTLTGKAPYKKVIGFGMLVNEDGAKFSKTGSNNILLDGACDQFGADVIRYMFAANNMLADTRFGEGVVEEVKRKFMGLWNSYVFFNTYAVLDNPNLDGYKPDFNTLDKTDKWLIVRTNALKAFAENAYNTNTLYLLTKEVENFIDDLSNWYIRINRKRFWKGENQTDKLNAYYALYEAIKTLCQILAPITPYMTEYIWQNLVRELEPQEAESILLASFPKVETFEDEKQLLTDTEIVRNIITLAQRLRNENNLKVKQPLAKMYISANAIVQSAVLKFENIIKEELNIKEILFEENIDVFNTQYLAVNFKNAGRVLKGEVQKLKVALESLDTETMQKYLEEYKQGAVNIEPFGTLDKDIFVVQAKAKEEFVIATENMITVVLDTNLTEELVEEGIFRELVRVLQVVRKEAGFNVEDRINAKFETTGVVLSKVINKYLDKIMQDVLITEMLSTGEFDFEKTVEIAGETINIFVKK